MHFCLSTTFLESSFDFYFYPKPCYLMNHLIRDTVLSLSLSRIPRDSLEHFEISVPRNIRVAELRKTINRITTFNKRICNLTPEDRDILKILCKRGEIAPLFHNILLPVLRFAC